LGCILRAETNGLFYFQIPSLTGIKKASDLDDENAAVQEKIPDLLYNFNRASFKTLHFGRSLRWSKISIFEIRRAFLRLKFSIRLVLDRTVENPALYGGETFEIGATGFHFS
jgi:hypothetical protein